MTMAKVSWFDENEGLIHAQNMPDEEFMMKGRDNRKIDMSDEFKPFLTEYLRDGKPGEFALAQIDKERLEIPLRVSGKFV
jgi:hypothetical protein